MLFISISDAAVNYSAAETSEELSRSAVEEPVSDVPASGVLTELEVSPAGVEEVVLLSVHAAMDRTIAAAMMTARIFFIFVYSF